MNLRLAFACIALLPTAFGAAAQESTLTPDNVGIVVNEADPGSVEVGEYFRAARRIPEANVLRVTVPTHERALSPAAFADLKRQVDETFTGNIEVVVFAWTTPYAVECNSLTAAMTLGFDSAQCENTCGIGKPSPYFNSDARRPSDLGMRLSMLLPAANVELAKAVVDRGRLSGFRRQRASAYFVITSDQARNSRARFFPQSMRIASRSLNVETLRTEGIQGKSDVMLYETGAISVPHLESLTFLPGALADHMTSVGGDLLGHSQMSSLRWLEAGATASYGTVSEPCNHWQKFPNPSVLLKHYAAGATAVEAYWKSVAWPAQGLFIGDPLAAPYCASCGRVTGSQR